MTQRHRYTTTLSFGTDGEADYIELEVEVSYDVIWGEAASRDHDGAPTRIDDLRVEKIDGGERPWTRLTFGDDDELASMLSERFDDLDHVLIDHAAREAA